MLATLAAEILAFVGLRRRSGDAPSSDPAEIARLVLEEPWKGNWDVIESRGSASCGDCGGDEFAGRRRHPPLPPPR